MAFKNGTKSGGRKVGTPNRSTTARQAAMEKVNAALNELGQDSLSGMKLLQAVIRAPDCPLDIRVQCSGLLLKHEAETATNTQYVVSMPPALPGDTPERQQALWWCLYGNVPAGEDPD